MLYVIPKKIARTGTGGPPSEPIEKKESAKPTDPAKDKPGEKRGDDAGAAKPCKVAKREKDNYTIMVVSAGEEPETYIVPEEDAPPYLQRLIEAWAARVGADNQMLKFICNRFGIGDGSDWFDIDDGSDGLCALMDKYGDVKEKVQDDEGEVINEIYAWLCDQCKDTNIPCKIGDMKSVRLIFTLAWD